VEGLSSSGIYLAMASLLAAFCRWREIIRLY